MKEAVMASQHEEFPRQSSLAALLMRRVAEDHDFARELAAAPIAAVARIRAELPVEAWLEAQANAEVLAQWGSRVMVGRSTQVGSVGAEVPQSYGTAGPTSTPVSHPNVGVPPPPVVRDPVLDCGSIHISNLVIGARVDVYFDYGYGLWPGTSVVAVTTSISVPRPTQLPLPIVAVSAQQVVGSWYSDFSNVAQVASGIIRRTPTGEETLCRLARNRLDGVFGGGEIRIGTDLGVPVLDGSGDLSLFFGDAFPKGQSPANVVKPIFKLRPEPPAFNGVHLDCPVLVPLTPPLSDACKEVASFEAESQTWFESLLVEGLPLDESFEVPSGAFFFDGKTYVFVTKRSSFVVVPSQIDPITGANGNIMLESFLVSRATDCTRFGLEFDGAAIDSIVGEDDVDCDDRPCVASGHALRFINIAPVVIYNEGQFPELPEGYLLLMWGTGLYHQSLVYFAFAELKVGQHVPPPTSWYFLTNTSPLEFKNVALPDVNNEIQPLALTNVTSAGEISVQWIEPLNRWLLLVWDGAPNGVQHGFVAEQPWGPWSPTPIFDQEKDPLTFDADSNHNIVLQLLPRRGLPLNWGYGNYIIASYTQWKSDVDTATIYLVSSFNRPSVEVDQVKTPFNPPDAYGTVLVAMDMQCTAPPPGMRAPPPLRLTIMF